MLPLRRKVNDGGVNDYIKAIPIVITGVFASSKAHSVMVKTPFRQPVVNIVHQCTFRLHYKKLYH